VQAIAKGRTEAAALLRNGDVPGAIAILDKLVGQYPDSAEIRKDREIAATEVAGQRREAQARAEKEAEEKAKREERARKQRAEAIAKGRDEAATLVQKGDLPGATAILDKLMEQYSDSAEIRKDREVAATKPARQQSEAQVRTEKEAEEKAKREAEERAQKGKREGFWSFVVLLALLGACVAVGLGVSHWCGFHGAGSWVCASGLALGLFALLWMLTPEYKGFGRFLFVVGIGVTLYAFLALRN
jgi:cobalamin biosynthesis Mg chelatase CobN